MAKEKEQTINLMEHFIRNILHVNDNWQKH